MANTSVVYVRMDSDLKDNAEDILSKLGISPSSAVQMLYSQIVLKKGMPFELRLPQKPVSYGSLDKESFDNELKKGFESLRNDRTYSVDEVDEILKQEFDI